VFCQLGDLAVAGPTINVAVVGRGNLAGAVANISATAEAKQLDPDESNNSATVSVTITTASSSDGGGFCSYQPNGKFDPILPLLVLIGLIYLVRKRRV